MIMFRMENRDTNHNGPSLICQRDLQSNSILVSDLLVHFLWPQLVSCLVLQVVVMLRTKYLVMLITGPSELRLEDIRVIVTVIQ